MEGGKLRRKEEYREQWRDVEGEGRVFREGEQRNVEGREKIVTLGIQEITKVLGEEGGKYKNWTYLHPDKNVNLYNKTRHSYIYSL